MDQEIAVVTLGSRERSAMSTNARVHPAGPPTWRCGPPINQRCSRASGVRILVTAPCICRPAVAPGLRARWSAVQIVTGTGGYMRRDKLHAAAYPERRNDIAQTQVCGLAGPGSPQSWQPQTAIPCRRPQELPYYPDQRIQWSNS